jgi:hypothetical protein
MTDSLKILDADILSIDPSKISLQELREAVLGNNARIPKVVALSALRSKDYPEAEKIADLERVMQDEQQSHRVRHVAALELGRIGSAGAIASLRRLSGVKNEFVQRGIMAALSMAGGEPESGPKSQTPHIGRSLVKQHLAAAPTAGLRFPEEAEFLSPQHGKEAAIAVAKPENATHAAKQPEIAQLGISLRTESALSVRCGKEDFLVLPTSETIDAKGPAGLLGKNGVAGVVALHHTVEIDTWSARYLVMTKASPRQNEFQILLTKPDGTIAYAGPATIQGKQARFTLRSVKHPGVIPAQIEGTLEAGVLHLNRVLSDLRITETTASAVRLRPGSKTR